MTSKKSFLVDLRTNARRRIWLVVLMFLGFLFTMTVLNAMILSTEKIYYSRPKYLPQYLGHVFASRIGLNSGMGLFISMTAVIAAIQGFSYMYQRKKLDLYMSVPVTARRRFAAIYLNGFLAYLIPYLCNVALSFLAAQAMGADISLALGEAGAAILGNTILYLAVYNVTLLAVMLTGNLIVTLLGTAVLLFYDGIVYMIHTAYMSTFFTSYYYRTQESLTWYVISPVIRFVMMVENSFSNAYSYERQLILGQFGRGCLHIAAVGIAALLLAYWCYLKKPAEVCGRAMAFPKTRAVIKILLTILSGLAGGVIFYDLSGNSSAFMLLGLAAGTLLAHGIIEVIYEFDIRSVKCGWKSLLIAAAGVAAVFSIFWFDLFRYDSYVPEAEQVDHIAFLFTDEYYNNYYDEEMNGVSREDYVFEHMQIRETEPLLTLAERRMGTDVTGEEQTETGYRHCLIRYQLKNGKVVYRQFQTAYREDAALLDQIVTDPAYQEGIFTIYNDAVVDLGSQLHVYYDHGSGGREVDGLDVSRLTDAYRKDLEDFTFTDQMEQLVLGKVYLECISQGYYVYVSLPVYPSFEETIALLRQQHLYLDGYLDPAEVEQIVIQNENSTMYDTGAEGEGGAEEAEGFDYTEYATQTVFDDPGEISQIAQALYPMSCTEYWMPDGVVDTDYTVNVVYTHSTGELYYNNDSYYMLADRIPDFVKEKTAYIQE